MDGLLDQIQGVPGRYGRRMQDRRVNGAVSGTLDTDFVLECSKRRLLKYCIRVSVRRDCIKSTRLYTRFKQQDDGLHVSTESWC